MSFFIHYSSFDPELSHTLKFTVWADNTAADTGRVVLKVRSDESAPGDWGRVVVNTHFSQAKPVLNFTPNHVETGVARDDTVAETVTLKNKGLASLNDVQVKLVNPNGTPAPAWVLLNTARNLGSIEVGASRKVRIGFAPTETVPEGVYTFYLRVTSANYPKTDINLYASVTTSGEGSVLFKVSDIYTATRDKNQQVINGLKGARVKLQNEAVLTQEYTKTTNIDGEAYFENIPSGQYKCRITAKNHQEYIGRVWIKPGVTAIEDIFLDYNLVTVEWEVSEITIEDKYDIVLAATYETNVPAAVVAIEPTSIVLPKMSSGDVYNGEFTLTNYGLVRAEAIKFNLPASDKNFKYELLGGLPDTLEAKERITIPYRVTCLRSLDQDQDGTGGGCSRRVRCLNIDYSYECANGRRTNNTASYCWTYSYGDCSSASGPVVTGSGGTWNIGGGGGGGGSVSSPAPAPRTIEGVKCFPQPERKESFCLPCEIKGAVSNFFQNVLSSVNLVMREYHREDVDLSVKVPGGRIEVKRWYFDNQWHWEDRRHNLKFSFDSLSGNIASIDKSGVIYEATAVDANVFTNEFYRILTTDSGWRWEHKNGEYKLFDKSGRMTEYGNRTGVIGRLLYEAGENGRLIGIADRNDNQVLWYEYDGSGRLQTVQDVAKRRIEYSYTVGRLSVVTDVLGNTTRFEYDGSGRINKIIDPENYAATVSYDKYGNVESVLDASGKGHFFEWDYSEGAKETMVRITSSAGKIREIWYDRDGEPTRVDVNGRTIQRIARDGRDLIITDENNRVTRKEYDEWDNQTGVVYPDGSSVSYKYEHKFNRRISETDENGVTTAYEYDADGNLTRMIEALGTANKRETEYTHDADGNLLTNKRLGDERTVEALTVMTYDAVGNLTTVTDPEGNLTRFTSHDIMGNVLTKEDAREKIWQYEYDVSGRLITVTDPLINVSRIYYDKKGNKVREVDPENKKTNYEYDQRGNLIKRTDHNGNAAVFEYDPDSRLIRQIDPEGKEIRYEYDADGRLVKTIDGNGNEFVMEYTDSKSAGCSSCGGSSDQPSRIIYPTFAKEFVYDERGRKTMEKDALGTDTYLTSLGYDDAGNLSSRTDKESRTTVYEYDNLNRLAIVTDPLNQTTEYFYDNRDNLTALTDANGNTTWFENDKNNRLSKETRPEGQQTTYLYDEAGNLIQKIDAKNQKTVYNYDDAGRLVEIHYFEVAGHVDPAKTVTFSYDRAGNLTGYNDGITSAIYTYDDLYRKVSETVNYGPFSQTNTYTYYKNGLKKTFTGPDGVTYQYTYDDNNQLTGVQIPQVGYITYSSYKWNRPNEVILPGGSRRQYEYDPLMRVKLITAKDPAQNILLNYQYNYDKMDNITTKATEHGEYGYGYDDLYRLTSTDKPIQTYEGFTYDAVGNRLTAAGVADDWSYNDNNELQSYDGVSFKYDANGNTVQKDDNGVVTNYIYNIEDRLERVEDGSGSLISSYYYDPFNRRLWKGVASGSVYFVYADEGLVAEVDVAGNVVKSYGYRPGSTWTTDPLFMKVSSEYYFYQNDHLGTPHKLTEVNGAVVWSAKHSSFGEANIDISSTVSNNLIFPGQYFDQETGLHYNYHRYYDSIVGRYLAVDPLGLKGGFNLYNYTGNNPNTMIDPFGLKKWRIEQSALSLSVVIIGGTVGSVCFVSECVQEPGIRKSPQSGWEDTICYWVFGGGLTVGLEASWSGNTIGALVDETNFLEEYPDPRGGMHVVGPSAGFIGGVTTVSADIAFNSYSNIGAGKADWMIGASIFTAEGRYYKFRYHHRRSCGCGGFPGGGTFLACEIVHYSF